MDFKQELMKEADKRIKKLYLDIKSQPKLIDNPRRIHPAIKQLKGRIKELRSFKKFINKGGED